MIRGLFILLLLLVSNGMEAQQPDTNLKEVFSRGSDIVDIDAAPSSQLFILERSRNRFLRLKLGDGQLDSLGAQGFGDYQFDGPRSIDASNGMKIYVSDQLNERIQVFDKRLQYLTSIQKTENRTGNRYFSPYALSVDELSQVFFFDENSSQIFRFNIRGEFDRNMEIPGTQILGTSTQLSSWDNRIYLSASDRNEVYQFTIEGKFINLIYTDSEPLDISADDGKLYILTTGNQIQVHRYQGARTGELNLPKRRWRSISALANTLYIASDTHVYQLKLDQ